jgi:penicillin-binding protein 1A
MTWHEIMAFAHQNTEIKPIPGLDTQGAPALAQAKKGGAPSGVVEVNATSAVPSALSRRSFEVIGGLGDLFRTVERPTATLTGFSEPARAAANTGSFGTRPADGRIALP